MIHPTLLSAVRRAQLLLVPTLIAGAVAAGTVTPAQAASAPSTSAVHVYRFTPIRLTVYDIEDGWPDSQDEPRMYYGTATWADSVRVGGYPRAIPSVLFTGTSMSVDLWERDGGWTDHNHLGWATVTNDLLGQEKWLRFKTSYYDYEIVYKVELVS